jgi:hypothetical protein
MIRVHLDHAARPALDADRAAGAAEAAERQPVEGRDILRVDVRRALELAREGHRGVRLRVRRVGL